MNWSIPCRSLTASVLYAQPRKDVSKALKRLVYELVLERVAHQLLGGAVLVEVAGGGGLERARRVLAFAVHGEHQQAKLRLLGLQPLDEIDAGEPGHRHVEHRDVVVVASHELQRLVAARRLR